jgi:hypothetical protein
MMAMSKQKREPFDPLKMGQKMGNMPLLFPPLAPFIPSKRIPGSTSGHPKRRTEPVNLFGDLLQKGRQR